ncbi:MAG TPA: hypothetical protein VGF22_00780 [Acidimicrobiales bacterium]|jgi:hypothetical protein
MSAQALHDDLRGYLRVSARVVSTVGDIIHVDEPFTVRVTGTNTAYVADVVRPQIVFNLAKVHVAGTQFAEVVGGDRWFDLPDKELHAGEASSVDVQMKAIFAFPVLPYPVTEPIATILIWADLDQGRFFEIWNRTTYSRDIQPN